MTEAFTVYPAKKFPGMIGSSALSRAFARQGFKLLVRREPDAKRVRTKHGSPATPRHGSDKSSALTSSASSAEPSKGVAGDKKRKAASSEESADDASDADDDDGHLSA